MSPSEVNPIPQASTGMRLCVVAAMLLSAVVLASLNIPGRPDYRPEILSNGKYGPHFEFCLADVEHGWPYVFLSHEGHYSPNSPDPCAWRIGRVIQFQPLNLFVDVGLAIGVVSIAGWYVSRRPRTRRLQVSIAEVLVVMACISFGLAYLAYRRHLHQMQITFLNHCGADPSYPEWERFGPFWLRSLTGDRFWKWGDRLASFEVLRNDDITSVPGKRHIKVLHIRSLRLDAMPSLRGFTRLQAIDMFMVSDESPDRNGDVEPAFWPCLRVIAQTSSIEGLNLYDNAVNDRCLQELGSMTALRNLELSGNSEITDVGLVHLRRISGLRQLGLWGTEVTAAGVSQLRESLPDCQVEWHGDVEQ